MVLNKNKVKNIISYSIVLLPLLGQYGFMTKSLTLADIVLIPLLILIFLINGKNKKVSIIDKRIFIFFVWYIFSAIMMSLIISELNIFSSIMSTIRCFIYSLAILCFSSDFIDIDKTLSLYTKVVLFLSCIIFVQVIIYKITGNIKPWVINSKYFPAVFVNDDYFSGGYLVQLGGSTFRASSLFSEPALFAQYVSPCLILNIFKDGKKNYWFLIMVTIATLLTKSANGMVYVIVAWIFTIFYLLYLQFKKKNRYIKSKYLIIIFVILIIFPFIYSNVYNYLVKGDNSLFSRLLEINDTRGESSGSMRVMRGWHVYSGLKLHEKIFGIGNGNIEEYLDCHSGIVPTFTQAYNGYMSGLSGIFVNSGLIGGILFFVWWITNFINDNKMSKALLLFLLVYLIASNSLFTLNFLLVLVLVITNNQIEEKLKKEKRLINENINNYIA